MDIGWAVRALKNGEKVRRAHWVELAGPCEEIALVSWVHLYYEQREDCIPAVMALQSDGRTDLHLLAEDWEPV